MQLSLVELLPELKRSLFLDVFARMSVDLRTKRPTLRTMEGQRVPAELKIRCLGNSIKGFPEGTVYKLDVRLVEVKNKKPYFSAVRNKDICRAVEFFEHNIGLQKGMITRKDICPKSVVSGYQK